MVCRFAARYRASEPGRTYRGDHTPATVVAGYMVRGGNLDPCCGPSGRGSGDSASVHAPASILCRFTGYDDQPR